MRTVTENQHKEVEEYLNRKIDYVSPEVYNVVKLKKDIEFNDANNVKVFAKGELTYS